MISVEHIKVQYGSKVLFNNVSFLLRPHDRIGLVGANGSGKTTLLKIVAGLLTPDRGKVHRANSVSVGYLPQDGVVESGKTLMDEASSAFEDVLSIHRRLHEAQEQLATLDPASNKHAETLNIVGELQHLLEDLDAFGVRSKVERVLIGLGFTPEDFHRPTEQFSGGWQMRIALATLLLRHPSLLLLDEPTNHLDIESQQWLEEYLQQYDGALMLVSHDRAFLDTLTRRTLALSGGTLQEFAGNYSSYEREDAARKELQLNAFKNQQKQLQQTQRFIERFRYKATKARQVQSRIRMLEKLECVEVEDHAEEIQFEFPQPQPSGRVVFELQNLTKRYGSLSVFEGLECKVERGDRIAVVGVNGVGKSTFARLLAGLEPFEDGHLGVGHNVIRSYFAQHQAEELDLSKEVLQTLDEVAHGTIRPKLRTLLGSFLFRGDDVFKPVSVLSGGEKSRLALAKMLLQPANVLILDEPTNHLDMGSKRVLQEALRRYSGTLIIVSHDRSFLDPLVTKVFEVRPGGIKVYLGTVSEYLERKKLERTSPPSSHQSQYHHEKADRTSRKGQKRREAERRQELHRLIKPLKEELEHLERHILGLEREQSELESSMADSDFYSMAEQVRRASATYHSIQQRLKEAYEKWSQLAEKISEVQQQR